MEDLWGPGSPGGFYSGRLAPVGFLSHPGMAFVLSTSYTRARDSGAERAAPSAFPELKTERSSKTMDVPGKQGEIEREDVGQQEPTHRETPDPASTREGSTRCSVSPGVYLPTN